MAQTSNADEGYNGLTQVERTLPVDWYRAPDHYQLELDNIWYRQWNYVCRSEELSAPRQYHVRHVGDQQIVVLRDEHGKLQAFHNTCRHRGSLLLTEPKGQLRGQSITCPYHAWSYSLQGDLKRTNSNFCQHDFNPAELSLYDVSVTEWRGFVFINLDTDNPAPLESCMDFQGQNLANWPLQDLVIGHSLRKTLDCNWKVFWENFKECLHCPGVHSSLSKLVPLYKRSMMEVKDDPHWQENKEKSDPRFKGGLAEGAKTWSADGQPCDSTFAGLTTEDINRGHTYEELLPTAFIVGHVDYVRIVWLTPLAPEQIEIQAQWLFRPETLAREDFDAASFAAYTESVMMEDAAVAELNQRGLRSIRHQQGVLLAEEYDVHNFHLWVKQQLGEAATNDR
jgi:phenylpropionate dioxygenase-like ring-hydroxylating dioxygenase large terminal subunit